MFDLPDQTWCENDPQEMRREMIPHNESPTCPGSHLSSVNFLQFLSQCLIVCFLAGRFTVR